MSTRAEMSVEIQDMKVRMDGPDRAFADFRQVNTSNAFRGTTQKTLEMIPASVASG